MCMYCACGCSSSDAGWLEFSDGISARNVIKSARSPFALALVKWAFKERGMGAGGGGGKSSCMTAKSYVEVEAIVLILLRNKHTHM